MIPTIETRARRGYPARMRSAALRMLALLAVLLLPFGMSAAPAEPHAAETMTMPAEHCPDTPERSQTKFAPAACSMACSAALPAADQPLPAAGPQLRIVAQPGAVSSLPGIELEIATPPPRAA